MRVRHITTATLWLFAACARPAPPFDAAIVPEIAPAALVDDDQALFVFPAPDSLQPCTYRRYGEPNAALYSWTINVDGPEQGWYVIDVWPAIRDTPTGRGRVLDLATILSMAHPIVGRAWGEPPMMTDVLDTTHVEARALDNRVVVRLTRSALVRRLFARRPETVRFVACHDGNDRWNRQVPVRYGRIR